MYYENKQIILIIERLNNILKQNIIYFETHSQIN